MKSQVINRSNNKKYVAVIVALTWVLISCGVSKLEYDQLQNLVPVSLYAKSTDYVNNEPMAVDAGILMQESSDQHITIKGVYDMKTGLKIKTGKTVWAINYKGHNYLNLYYIRNLISPYTYAKFDIEGKYCLIIIGKDSPKVLHPSTNQFGLSNVLANEIGKMSKNWVDIHREAYKVIFVDTDDIDPRSLDKCAIGLYMTKGKLEDVVEKHKLIELDSNLENITNRLEKAIEIIKTANAIHK